MGETLTAIFKENRKTYGAPRLQISLRKQGIRCGKNRIAHLQRQFGLRPVQKRRFRPRTTQSDPRLPLAENELAKVPTPDRPQQIWVGDIPYIETREGWLYLAGILDLYSRKVAGWNTSDSLATELVTIAWKRAWKKHRPGPGLLHHSDRGCQHASKEFRSLLSAHQAGASMSSKGNCYDNAAMESFWATLKTECFGSTIPDTRDQAKLMIFEYIEGFYNRTRLHSALGYKSPLDFESLRAINPNKNKSPSKLFRRKIKLQLIRNLDVVTAVLSELQKKLAHTAMAAKSEAYEIARTAYLLSKRKKLIGIV